LLQCDALCIPSKTNCVRFRAAHILLADIVSISKQLTAKTTFDKDGNVKNKKLFVKELSDKDSRNGSIHTYLYNQSLIFVQIHRDTIALLMDIVLLSYEDDFITKNSFYFDKIKCNNIFNFNKVNQILNKRFIKFTTSETNYLFDMGINKN
jgi:hypothetical protein